MRNYILLIIALILLGFNIYNLDFQNLLSDDGKVAIIGVLGCLVAIVLLLILNSSSKIKNKLEK
jgi:FtsH-binding integral membrane protein|tara:strand:+ start:4557 stop:4748 length:192 start_codon:yes stop_codon:yes gene_type:complete